MALTPEQQKQLNQYLKEGLLTQQQFNRALGGALDFAEALDIALQNSRNTTADLYSISQDINDELRKALGISIKRSKQDSDILKTNNDITNQLGKQIKDYNSIESINRDIKKNKDLAKKADEQASKLIRGKTKDVNKILKGNSQINKLQDDLMSASGKEAAVIEGKISAIEAQNKALQEGLTPRQKGGLLLLTQSGGLKEQNKLLKKEAAERQVINDRLGVTGGLLKSAQKIMGKFGLEGLSDQFDGLNQKLEGLAREGKSKAKIMGNAFAGIGKIAKKGLGDPLIQLKLGAGAVVAIFKFFLDLVKIADGTMNSIVKNTGLQAGAAENVYRNIQAQGEATDNILMNTVSLTEAFTKLTEQTGLLADFGGKTLETFTVLTKQLGMGEQQATKLTMMARMQGKETEKVLGQTVEVVNTINKQNRTALSAKEILKEVANVSADIAVTLGQSPQKIAEAAAEAKLLGLSLNEVAGVADGLLNIENSIQKEMEAEIILGKNLNLEKARSLALDNDMAGLAKELRNQEEIMSAFRSGNRVQQEAAAAALGLSREQLAQMIQMEDYRAMSQQEYIAAYGEQSYEQMKQLTAQEEMNAAMMEFKIAMADVAVQMIPIVKSIAEFIKGLAQSKGAARGLITILKVIAALAIGSMIANIIKAFSVIPVVGPAIGMGVAGTAIGMIIAAQAKMKKAKDFRQKAGQTGVMSQTLGGLETVVPAKEDDVVMGPGILDKLENVERMGGSALGNITDSVLSAKSSVQDKVVVNNDNSELVSQNKKMMEMFSSMNTTLSKINNKESSVYLGSEQVQKNLNRSTAGMR